MIELLVVISIIALLMGLLLPALAAVRMAAVRVQCQSQLNQIAAGMLAYEADFRRLPASAYEAGDTDTFPASIKGPTFDGRELYRPYVEVDFFVCPNVKSWKPSQATSAVINVDYVMTPGYYGDGTGSGSGGVFTSVFTRSDRPWSFNSDRFTVLIGDRSYLDPVTEPGTWRQIVNDPGAVSAFNEWSPPGFAGSAYLASPAAGTDLRGQTFSNFAFADGHVELLGPGATNMKPIPNRMISRIGSNYLLPAE